MRTRGTPLAALFVAGLAASAAAQPPLLTAEARAVPLARAQVEVTLAGLLARTATTLTFRNDLDRPLEGELVFPLPDGATVSGYALDVDGVLVDGVAVEARAARVAFETETRRRVDPGLVEHVRGNSFRTRVWPIPARGTRTVRIAYVSDLAADPRADEASYVLPPLPELPPAGFSLRIEVVEPTAAPELRPATAALRFARMGPRYVAEARQTANPAEEWRVVLPRAARPRALVEPGDDGGWYFVLDDFPEPPAAEAPVRGLRRVAVLWDASLSRGQADTARERAWLASLLAAQRDVQVELTVFRNVPEPTRRIRVQAGDARALLGELERVVYDGGTRLEGLPRGRGSDAVILFSDGLATLGDAAPPRAAAPLFAVSTSRQADHALLRRAAEASGGAYLNLALLGEEAAARQLLAPPLSLLSVDAEPGAIADVVGGAGRPLRERVTVAGRLLAPQATITLRYGRGSKQTASRSFAVRRGDAARTGLAARSWAQQKAAALALEPRLRPELVALGRRFGLVTPATSLLVLETLQQHLAHGIVPPKSRPEMRADYLRAEQDAKQQRKVVRRDKLESVVAQWRQQQEWWRGDFSAPEPPRRKRARSAPRDERPQQQPRPSPPQPVAARPCRGDAGGQVAGAVTDSSGAEIPGAQVTLTGQATGAGVFVVTDAAGRYRVCGLSPGRYEMRAELQGFRTFVARVAVGDRGTVQLPVTLDVGGLQETITVEAATPLLMTSSATRASTSRGSAPEEAAIAVEPWDPGTPYLAALESVPLAEAYPAYLRERERFAGSPAFFLDCADFFYRNGAPDLGLRVLTSVLELRLDEPRLLRVAAHRLQQAGELELALALFRKVAELRPEEPHSPRDLALALAARGDAAREKQAAGWRRTAAEDYRQALALLNDVVLGEWDRRFDGIEVIALVEANRLLAVLEQERLPGAEGAALDPRLRGRVDVDLRVLLTWDTDMTDMDLAVTEPDGEECSYSNTLTDQGGKLSRDLTDGYGPEEYALRRAAPGEYAVEANYFGSRATSVLGPTTLQATIVTNYARPNEKRQAVTLRLAEAKDSVVIGSARFGPAPR